MLTRFREDKTTQAATKLLRDRGGRMSYLKLIKLLYIADREALIRWGRPITYDTYVSMKHGPVLSATLNRIKAPSGGATSTLWHRHIERVGDYSVQVRAGTDASSDNLAPVEVQLLEEVCARYGSMDKWKLVELVHKFPEWVDPETMNQKVLPIDPRDILRDGGFEEEDIDLIQQEIEATSYADRILG